MIYDISYFFVRRTKTRPVAESAGFFVIECRFLHFLYTDLILCIQSASRPFSAYAIASLFIKLRGLRHILFGALSLLIHHTKLQATLFMLACASFA